jgi:hypothetical protein
MFIIWSTGPLLPPWGPSCPCGPLSAQANHRRVKVETRTCRHGDWLCFVLGVKRKGLAAVPPSLPLSQPAQNEDLQNPTKALLAQELKQAPSHHLQSSHHLSGPGHPSDFPNAPAQDPHYSKTPELEVYQVDIHDITWSYRPIGCHAPWGLVPMDPMSPYLPWLLILAELIRTHPKIPSHYAKPRAAAKVFHL